MNQPTIQNSNEDQARDDKRELCASIFAALEPLENFFELIDETDPRTSSIGKALFDRAADRIEAIVMT